MHFKHSEFRIWGAAGIMILALLLHGGCSSLKRQSRPGEALQLIPITAEPTSKYHPGKIVWHDLITPDSVASRTFYSGLLGWSFREHENYIEIRNGDHRIGGIFEIKPKNGERGTAEWLMSVSVPDVDQAVSYVESQGGKIIHSPVDMPLRGRGAMIGDPWGAHLVVLHAKGGDPPDKEPGIGDWLWNENWNIKLDEPADFYRKLGYYKTIIERSRYTILINEDKWRAGVRQIEEENYSGRWIPVVRVEDPEALLEKVESLGGLVWMKPGEKTRNEYTTLICDNNGALLILQKWTFPDDGEED